MIEVAKKAAIEAGRVALSVRLSGITAKAKGGIGNFSTEGDLLAEKKIVDIISKNFPNHGILSEESVDSRKKSKYLWVIDPIDGTIIYYSGLDMFGVSVGLFRDNKPFLGAIYFPVLKLLFWAKRGEGAYLNDKKISVSPEKLLNKSVVGFDCGYSNRKAVIENILMPLVDNVCYTLMSGCAVFAMTNVARGFCQANIHTGLIWDFAAASIIVEEAGGRVTDYRGKPIDWTKDWIDVVASNGLIHNEIIKLINKK